jgi:stearoyl-CoA desaturase (delta-9 desaturase)
MLGVACFWIGGWSGLIVGFFASTVLLWHVTFTVNSLAHVFGRRAYETDDTSRNNVLIAIATAGEGWHNNHHRYPFAARQGFRWWQIDTTYYVLRGLAALGVVRDLRPVPAEVIAEGYKRKPRKSVASGLSL